MRRAGAAGGARAGARQAAGAGGGREPEGALEEAAVVDGRPVDEVAPVEAARAAEVDPTEGNAADEHNDVEEAEEKIEGEEGSLAFAEPLLQSRAP